MRVVEPAMPCVEQCRGVAPFFVLAGLFQEVVVVREERAVAHKVMQRLHALNLRAGNGCRSSGTSLPAIKQFKPRFGCCRRCSTLKGRICTPSLESSYRQSYRLRY